MNLSDDRSPCTLTSSRETLHGCEQVHRGYSKKLRNTSKPSAIVSGMSSLSCRIREVVDLLNPTPVFSFCFSQSENKLTGRLPTTFGNMVKLVDLRLFDNKLTGTIPSVFSEFTDLENLSLEQNQLSGTIPSQLAELKHLRKSITNASTSRMVLGVPAPIFLTQSSYCIAIRITSTLPQQVDRKCHRADLRLDQNTPTLLPYRRLQAWRR